MKFSTYNTDQSRWKADPGGMIEKVAKSQALRDAFPTALGGLYVAEEMQRVTEVGDNLLTTSEPIRMPKAKETQGEQQASTSTAPPAAAISQPEQPLAADEALRAALGASTDLEVDEVLAGLGMKGQFPANLYKLPEDKKQLAIAELHKRRLRRQQTTNVEPQPAKQSEPAAGTGEPTGIQHVQTVIREVRVLKRGQNKSGPWTFYLVVDDQKNEYITFSDRLANDAQQFGAGQTVVDLAWKRGKKGQEIMAVVAAEPTAERPLHADGKPI